MAPLSPLKALTLLLCAVPFAAQAQLIFHEPFNYSAGSLGSLTAAWEESSAFGPAVPVVDSAADQGASLNVTGLSGPVGNRVRFVRDVNGANGAGRIFPSQSSGIVYASFLMKVPSPADNFGTSAVTIRQVSGTGPAASTATGTGLYIGPGTNINSFRVGVNVVSSGPLLVIPFDYSKNDTMFVVLSYQLVAGSANNVTRLWINPTPGLVSPPVADITAQNSTDISAPNQLYLTSGGFDDLTLEFDEIRVGTTWTSVTPSNATIDGWEVYH